MGLEEGLEVDARRTRHEGSDFGIIGDLARVGEAEDLLLNLKKIMINKKTKVKLGKTNVGIGTLIVTLLSSELG